MKTRIDIALLVGATAWCALLVVAPLFSLAPVYAFFSLICHQSPDRSWILFGHPMPVCIRCSAIYFGFLFALALKPQPRALWLRIAVGLTLGEVLFELTVVDSVLARSITGILLGAAAAPFVRVGVAEMFGVRQDAV